MISDLDIQEAIERAEEIVNRYFGSPPQIREKMRIRGFDRLPQHVFSDYMAVLKLRERAFEVVLNILLLEKMLPEAIYKGVPLSRDQI